MIMKYPSTTVLTYPIACTCAVIFTRECSKYFNSIVSVHNKFNQSSSIVSNVKGLAINSYV